jgi:1-acyl-sn-glycerol-3-phosphate acyltransferase
LLPFKLGGLKMAYEQQIPIIPIVLYYTNKNHYHMLPKGCSTYDFIMESIKVYKYTGDLIVHQCNDGNDVLPLPDETFEEFHKRIYNMMQSQINEFNIKNNREIE